MGRQATQHGTVFGWQPGLVGSARCAWSSREALAARLSHLPSGGRPPSPCSLGWCHCWTWPQPLCKHRHSPRGDAHIAPDVHSASGGLSKAEHQNTPPFPQRCFQIVTWQQTAKGGAILLQSQKDWQVIIIIIIIIRSSTFCH